MKKKILFLFLLIPFILLPKNQPIDPSHQDEKEKQTSQKFLAKHQTPLIGASIFGGFAILFTSVLQKALFFKNANLEITTDLWRLKIRYDQSERSLNILDRWSLALLNILDQNLSAILSTNAKGVDDLMLVLFEKVGIDIFGTKYESLVSDFLASEKNMTNLDVFWKAFHEQFLQYLVQNREPFEKHITENREKIQNQNPRFLKTYFQQGYFKLDSFAQDAIHYLQHPRKLSQSEEFFYFCLIMTNQEKLFHAFLDLDLLTGEKATTTIPNYFITAYQKVLFNENYQSLESRLKILLEQFVGDFIFSKSREESSFLKN